MNLYRHILKKSLRITWENKFLWFFGFFATFLGGFGAYEILINRTDAYFAQNLFFRFQHLQELNVFSGEFFLNVGRTFQVSPISMSIVFALLIILLILFIFLLWLAVVSQVGLVFSSAKIVNSDKNAHKLNIKRGIETGIDHFWPVLGLNFLSKVLVYFLFFCLSLFFVFLVSPGNGWVADMFYVVLFIIFIPIALIISFIFNYAICYISIEKKEFKESILDAWNLFLRNWLVTLEMALILFVITFLATMVFILAAIILSVPILLFVNFLLYWGDGGISFWVIIASGILLGALMAVVGAIITTFRISSWTTLFLHLNSKKESPSKIVRLAEKIKN